MGNHHSVPSGVKLPSLGRTGSLGLSKSELDKRCKPSGIYPSCKWEDRAIRRLIGDGKLAARLRGSDSRSSAKDRECPICFLHYSQTNVTSCCKAYICTECYLQVRPQKEKHSSCPFCNHCKVTVKVAKDMKSADIIKRDEEEQCVIEAMIKAQTNREALINPAPTASRSTSTPNEDADEDAEFLDSDGLNESGPTPLSPEERHLLEQEMRAQHNHPLSLSMRREAQQRREENEREFFRQHGHRLNSYQRGLLFGAAAANSGFRISSRPNSFRRSQLNRIPSDLAISGRQRGSRDWDQILQSFHNGNDRDSQSFDDMVLLEAAIMLSMEDQMTRARDSQTSEGNSNTENGESTNNDTTSFSTNPNNLSIASTASEEPNEQEVQQSEPGRRSISGNEGDAETSNHNMIRDAALREFLGQRFRDSFNMNASEILMSGITEEEQVAVAIALSLRDAQGNRNQQTNEEENDVSRQEQISGDSSEDVNDLNTSSTPYEGHESNTPNEASESNTPIEASESNTPIEASESNTPNEASESNTPIEASESSTPSSASNDNANTTINQP